jgi:hypothetical protein
MSISVEEFNKMKAELRALLGLLCSTMMNGELTPQGACDLMPPQ